MQPQYLTHGRGHNATVRGQTQEALVFAVDVLHEKSRVDPDSLFDPALEMRNDGDGDCASAALEVPKRVAHIPNG